MSSELFDIGSVSLTSPHLCADLVEILATVNYKGNFFIHKNDFLSIANEASLYPEDLDEYLDIEKGLNDRAKTDRTERLVEDIWSHLEYRQRIFNVDYPFIIEKDEIAYRKGNLSNGQRIYKFLLACSRLNSFKKHGVQQRWARSFSQCCKEAMSSLLPTYATVRVFDANSIDRRKYYGTDLRNALLKLGKDLAVLSINKNQCSQQSSSGDAGIDLVGIIDFDDSLTANYAILGQCASQQKNWPDKILEANALNLRAFYQMTWDVPAVTFIPVFYRDTNGAWISAANTSGSLLIDRARIVFLLKKLSTKSITNRIIKSDWFSNFEDELKEIIQSIPNMR